ncbi:hypothetical protein [Microcella sp.]|uniref:hypothetical protein n=1 Tax=Microcella sp. TaxID=1913979 RepID=UPI002565AE3F|nr:hypothetical protein [Microcella sp.]MBX9471570.1 hypothetical protein [Microcella sp.]
MNENTNPSNRDGELSAADESVAPDPDTGTSHTVLGGILLAVGLAGIVFFFGRPSPSDEAGGFAIWNTVIVVSSALCAGVGAYLLMRGISHRRRRSSRRG